MTYEEENKIRSFAHIEKTSENEYTANWGDKEGHGETPITAVENLITGMEFEEADYFAD